MGTGLNGLRKATPATQPAASNGNNGNGSQWVDETPYIGIVGLKVKGAAAKSVWDALLHEPWGCLAVNIVEAFKAVDPERGNNLLELIHRNMAPNAPAYEGQSRVRKWGLGSAGMEGRWVKLTDSSVLHFQQTDAGVAVSAWLWGYMAGRRDLLPEDGLTSALLPGISVVGYVAENGEQVEGIAEYINALDYDRHYDRAGAAVQLAEDEPDF